LPEGSSLFKRFEKGEVKPEDFGLTEVPEAGVKLSEPLLDVSTKLEKRDRYLPWGEAQQLAQLSDEQLTEIKKLTLKVNDFVTQHAEKVGLEHADGKIEFAVDEQGDLILVDVFGTPDENRFLYQGTHLSKQVLRNYYKKLPWHAEFLEKGFEHKPPKADPKLISLVSDMYKSVCNVWCQDSTFDVPKMSEVVQRYKEYLNNN
jgi:phosphoribosylaminoimidazole-succinocarboxamide synthase